MLSTTVSTTVDFEFAYLMKLKGKPILNSHRYTMVATVGSPEIQDGIIIDYDELREILLSSVPDKTFVASMVNSDKELNVAKALQDYGVPIKIVSFELCTERLAELFAKTIQSKLDEYHLGYILLSLILQENNSSSVNWQNQKSNL